ncbi:MULTISPECIES: YraN family protein [Anaerolinea]|uniref:YraN family protein n=1 Tax=Anaerolinea TaxID=233189 RepID=UPI00262539CE|nr:YraN family protein [Anaerolinea thermophila]
MNTYRQRLGKWGEDLAVKYLTQKGYIILARNVRTEFGEIDIVAQRGETMIFVEVKTRTSQDFGYPESALTPQKKSHLLSAIQAYLQKAVSEPPAWQVDILAIEREKGKEPLIEHFENALTE